MKFDCSFTDMVKVNEIKPHPKNNNTHPNEQVEAFQRVISKKGVWRVPLIASKRSGLLVSGHLRLQVAKNLGLKELPVVYQDFKTEADEYQFLTFDNEIARWASLDLEAVKIELQTFTDLKLEDLGIKVDLGEGDLVDDEDREPRATDDGYSIFELVMQHDNKTRFIDTLNDIKKEHSLDKQEDALMVLVNDYKK